MLIMCVDYCLVFVQNNLFRILLSVIVNFICFITCPTNINCLCNFVSRYLFKIYLLINNIVTPTYMWLLENKLSL